jgi:hypothetical protein
MGLETTLRRTVVVRRHHQHPGDTKTARLTREVHGVRGVVRAGARDHRDGDRLGHRGPERKLLVVGEHRRLAGGARDHKPVVAVLGEVAGERARAVEIERAVVVERRDHGGEHPPETTGHQKLPSEVRSMRSVRMRSSWSSIQTSW